VFLIAIFFLAHRLIYIICTNHFAVEGTTSPTATASAFAELTPLEGPGLYDGIKADDKRVVTNGQGFFVITLGQSQVIKKVRVYTDEVKE
jgi:hypothetical protein